MENIYIASSYESEVLMEFMLSDITSIIACDSSGAELFPFTKITNSVYELSRIDVGSDIEFNNLKLYKDSLLIGTVRSFESIVLGNLVNKCTLSLSLIKGEDNFIQLKLDIDTTYSTHADLNSELAFENTTHISEGVKNLNENIPTDPADGRFECIGIGAPNEKQIGLMNRVYFINPSELGIYTFLKNRFHFPYSIRQAMDMVGLELLIPSLDMITFHTDGIHGAYIAISIPNNGVVFIGSNDWNHVEYWRIPAIKACLRPTYIRHFNSLYLQIGTSLYRYSTLPSRNQGSSSIYSDLIEDVWEDMIITDLSDFGHVAYGLKDGTVRNLLKGTNSTSLEELKIITDSELQSRNWEGTNSELVSLLNGYYDYMTTNYKLIRSMIYSTKCIISHFIDYLNLEYDPKLMHFYSNAAVRIENNGIKIYPYSAYPDKSNGSSSRLGIGVLEFDPLPEGHELISINVDNDKVFIYSKKEDEYYLSTIVISNNSISTPIQLDQFNLNYRNASITINAQGEYV